VASKLVITHRNPKDMANHEYKTASSPLAQLVLIKSPYLQLPHPVTLPYNYTPLPSSVDTIVQPPVTHPC
jgi:hypothetical protein